MKGMNSMFGSTSDAKVNVLHKTIRSTTIVLSVLGVWLAAGIVEAQTPKDIRPRDPIKQASQEKQFVPIGSGESGWKLTLQVEPTVLAGGGEVTLSGALSFNVGRHRPSDTSVPPNAKPKPHGRICGRELTVTSTTGEVVGKTITDSEGKYSLKLKPNATTTYKARVTGYDAIDPCSESSSLVQVTVQ